MKDRDHVQKLWFSSFDGKQRVCLCSRSLFGGETIFATTQLARRSGILIKEIVR